MSIFSVFVVFSVSIHSHSTPAFFTRCCDSFFSTSLSMHFVFAFMFHLFLSLFLLFGIVDARAATVNPLQIFRLNDRRCNVFFYHHHRRLFFCSRFCLPLCCVIAPWLVSSMDASVFFFSLLYLGIFPIFIGVFAVFSHSFSALWNYAMIAFVFEISLLLVSFCIVCIGTLHLKEICIDEHREGRKKTQREIEKHTNCM